MFKIQKKLGIITLALLIAGLVFGSLLLGNIIPFSGFLEIGLLCLFITALFIYLSNWIVYFAFRFATIFLKDIRVKEFSNRQNKFIISISLIALCSSILTIIAYNYYPDEKYYDYFSYGWGVKLNISKDSFYEKAMFELPKTLEFNKEILAGFYLEKSDKNTNNKNSNKYTTTTDFDTFEFSTVNESNSNSAFYTKILSSTKQSFSDTSGIYWYALIKPVSFGLNTINFKITGIDNNNIKDIVHIEKEIMIDTPFYNVILLVIIDFFIVFILILFSIILIISFFFFREFENTFNRNLIISDELKSEIQELLFNAEIKDALILLRNTFKDEPLISDKITKLSHDYSEIVNAEILDLWPLETISNKKSNLAIKVSKLIGLD